MKRITSVLLVLGLLVGTDAAVAVAKAPGKAKPRAAKVQQRGLLPAAAAYLGVTPVALGPSFDRASHGTRSRP